MSDAAAVQKAVVGLLVADAGVGALVGNRIWDGPPQGGAFPFVQVGDLNARLFDGHGVTGIDGVLDVHVWSRAQGSKVECRRIMDAVRAALHHAEPALDTGTLVLMRVGRWRDLTDPDGVTAHGIVSLTIITQD